MVSQPLFVQFANQRLSYFPVDVTALARLPTAEKDKLNALMTTHKVEETPDLLFLTPDATRLLHRHSGYEDDLTAEVFLATATQALPPVQ